jgi:hypothetical protein
MKSPFPGMDPYLEHPSLWPDVHNRLIAAIADTLVPQVAPNYYVALEQRTYLLKPDDVVLVGRPDVAMVAKERAPTPLAVTSPEISVLDVDVPMSDEINETYLEIREVQTRQIVTILELLLPTNKLNDDGRKQYQDKRTTIFRTRTSLVEIDLLRAGEAMSVVGNRARSDYRILVSRGWERPHARLYTFSVRRPIPEIPVPLRKGEAEPILSLNEIFHALYTRARFDLRLDYTQPAVPPLEDDVAAWAAALLSGNHGS